MLKSVLKAIFPARWLSYCKRRVLWTFQYPVWSKSSFQHFTCNICGKKASFPQAKMMRETASCIHCGSCVRFRSIVHTLSMELFGESLAIKDFPARQDLTGVGMSDWEEYARRLKKKLNYTNTYYHKEPLLNIASPELSQPGAESGLYDFIIATEVFEHVSQPIARAFENVHRLLKPGGVFIFSVPCVEGNTVEHFPELWRFTVSEEKESWVLRNETIDGRQQRYDHLIFHGGPGTTLEMRLFGRDSLVKNFADAGFLQLRNHDEEVPAAGIVWNPYIPEEAHYRPVILGLGAPPWSARKG